MGRQMYFYYLEWLFVYNQNKSGYLQITTLQFYYFLITKIQNWLFTNNQELKSGYFQITKMKIGYLLNNQNAKLVIYFRIHLAPHRVHDEVTNSKIQ